jgi:pyruvate dehydrogenase phosphatase
MQVRAFQGALVAAAVAAGAFYASGGPRSFGTSTSLAADQSPTADSVETAEVTRRALVVDNEQLFTGTITGNGPVSKETDDQGRKVLEMLTPEQATHKLRKNEESWIVGRGQGVVRYDVVQSRFFPSSSCPPFWMSGAGTPEFARKEQSE